MLPERSTRRAVLGLSVAAVAGLAGCAALSPDAGGSGTPSPTASEPEYSHSVDAPDSATVRKSEGEPAVRSSAHDSGEDMFESEAAWDYEDWIVTSPSERDVLEFSRGADGVEAARAFVAATDLSETTLLVHQYDVASCETRRLDRLKWGPGFSCGDVECVGLFLSYEPTECDGDCGDTESEESDGPPYSEGSHASEATFVRIPARIGSYGRFSVQY